MSWLLQFFAGISQAFPDLSRQKSNMSLRREMPQLSTEAFDAFAGSGNDAVHNRCALPFRRPQATEFKDPRYWQILSLALLLIYGLTALGFDQRTLNVVIILVAALLAQWVCSKAIHLPRYDPLSALISALSLCLLLRSDQP